MEVTELTGFFLGEKVLKAEARTRARSVPSSTLLPLPPPHRTGGGTEARQLQLTAVSCTADRGAQDQQPGSVLLPPHELPLAFLS